MTEQTQSGISRRTLAKGAAWSVPAAAVVAAAPAYANSVPEIEIDFGSSSACKMSGASFEKKPYCYKWGYVLWGVFENNTALDATVTINSITVGDSARCIVGLADYTVSCSDKFASNTFTIEAGETRYIAIYTNANGDSASNVVTVGFNYTLTGQSAKSSSQTGTVTGGTWQGSCSFPTNAAAGCKANGPMSVCGTSCEIGATSTSSTTTAPTTTTTTTEPTTTTATTAP